MNEFISPKYLMKLIGEVDDAIWKEYSSYKQVLNYIEKWHEEDWNDENFHIEFKDEARSNIDLNRTLHRMSGDIVLKIAIDLGIDTPGFIPSIPNFKNAIKSDYKTAYSTLH